MSNTDYNAVRERLRKSELSHSDVEILDQMLRERVEMGDLGEIGGRRIIARLPNGMDIIK